MGLKMLLICLFQTPWACHPCLASTHLWKCLVLQHRNENFPRHLNPVLLSIRKFISFSRMTSTSATGYARAHSDYRLCCLHYTRSPWLSLVDVPSLWHASWQTLPSYEGPHLIHRPTPWSICSAAPQYNLLFYERIQSHICYQATGFADRGVSPHSACQSCLAPVLPASTRGRTADDRSTDTIRWLCYL